LHYYAEENPPTLQEERMLRDWCNSPLSLYRVLEVRPGRGLLMDDLLRHGEYELLNENIAMGVEPWSLLVTRLLPVGGCYGYAGVLISIPPFLQNEMLQELDNKLKRFSLQEKPPHRGHPAWPEFLLEHGYILFSAVHSLRLRWESSLAEEFAGMEDRDLFAALTTCFLANPNEALRRFLTVPGLVMIREKQRGENETPEYTWEWYGPGGSRDDLKGYLQLQGDYLTLQCFTRGNLEKGKTFIHGLIGEMVISQRDNFINLEDNKQEEDYAPEVDEFLQSLFESQSCREWIHTPIPELQGKTPFQLRMEMEDEELDFLETMIAELENNQSLASFMGIEHLDFKALRQSLLLGDSNLPFRASHWEWEQALYRDVACLLEEISEVMEFTPWQLANALRLWQDFVRAERPLLKKPEAWAGAVAYLISSLDFGEYTQKDLAAYFNVSSGAVSSNSIRIKFVLDLEKQPGRYRSICYQPR